ncbi:MAG: DNA polymerase III subunit [Anaerolineales bacterium]|nr:DNA polymerase III subunit [Anaerolineales bacterium]
MPWNLIGHEPALALLQRDLAQDRLRHAYLFVGPEGVGKRTLVTELARALLCEDAAPPCNHCRHCALAIRDAHPDLLTVTPVISGKRVRAEKIRIEPVRQLIYDLSLKPVEAKRRVARLLDFGMANAEAMNALLKTLEEPPGNAILLLTAESADELLPTIVSRCEVIALRPLPLAVVRDALITRWLIPHDQAELLAHLSGGRLGWAVRLAQDAEALEERRQKLDDVQQLLSAPRLARFQYAEKLAREASLDRVQATLELWESFWRDVLLAGAQAAVPLTNLDRQAVIRQIAGRLPPQAAHQTLQSIRRTGELLARNVNARLALETLLLDWPRL